MYVMDDEGCAAALGNQDLPWLAFRQTTVITPNMARYAKTLWARIKSRHAPLYKAINQDQTQGLRLPTPAGRQIFGSWVATR